MRRRVLILLATALLSAALTACAQQARGAAAMPVPPEGWIEIKPGMFQPAPGSDPTLLGQASFPGASLTEVASTWQLPERSARKRSAGLTWDLYYAEMTLPDVGTLAWDIALAEDEQGAYATLLVTLVAERERLYDDVFIPSLGVRAGTQGCEERPDGTPGPSGSQRPQPVATRVRPADGMVMVYVPAGEFVMGHEGTRWGWDGTVQEANLTVQVFTDEGPEHAVWLESYWIDQTEVTVGKFRQFVEATGYETTAEREGWAAPWRYGPPEAEWPHVEGADWRHPRGPESSAEDDHPVVQVSWDDAAAYCAWVGGGLPTEAQWEKAARGTDARGWPWGDWFDGTRGSFCGADCPVTRHRETDYGDGYAFTAPAGSFPDGASPYGALDMAGNVWEWVADWYADDFYGQSAARSPTGPATGTERAQRGGAWYDTQPWVRCTVRHQGPSWVRCDDLGFRCAVPADTLGLTARREPSG